MTRSLPIALLLAALTAVPSRSPPVGRPDTANVALADSLVAAWVADERVPGAVLRVSRGGEVVLERAYGHAQAHAYGDGRYGAWRTAAPEGAVRRLEHPVRMTSATRFDLASVTKVMATTMAVMLLVDGGELDLDEPLSTVLPDFGGGLKEAITTRHLLTHRAGLAQWKPVYYHAANAEQAYAWIRDLPLEWEPGEGRHYSDLGFMLLGFVVERVSGMRLDDFLRDRLYEPLGLRETDFRRTAEEEHPEGGMRSGDAAVFAATSHGNPYEYRMVHDSTFGYRIEGDPDAWDGWRRRSLIGEVNDGNAYHAFQGVAGHAGLFATAGELDVLLQLLLNRGEYGGRRYVGSDVVDEFLASTGNGQALGWQVPDYAPTGGFTHTGFTGTWVLGVPEDRLSVVLLTNRQNGGVDSRGLYPDVGPLQRAVASALLGER